MTLSPSPGYELLPACALGAHRFQRAPWVRIASSVRGFIIPEIDRISEMTNPRALEAARTQGGFHYFLPRGDCAI